MTPGRFVELTPRELQVLKLIEEGHRYQTIGNMLKTSSRTVEVHLQNIKAKAHLHGSVRVVLYWFNHVYKPNAK